jgi:hypothetical protein
MKKKITTLLPIIGLLFLSATAIIVEAGTPYRLNYSVSDVEITGTPAYLPIVMKPMFTSTSTPTSTPTKTPTSTSTSTPTKTPTNTPTKTPTPTQAPVISGNIQIIGIFYDGSGSSEPDEYVTIRNDDSKSIQLQNWTLRDIANHVYIFPGFVISPNQVCRIYTNENHPEYCGFNYGSGVAIWNNTGDCAYIRDSTNTLIDDFCY